VIEINILSFIQCLGTLAQEEVEKYLELHGVSFSFDELEDLSQLLTEIKFSAFLDCPIFS